jgi:hypothetical protein
MRVKVSGYMDLVVINDDHNRYVISKNAEHVSFSLKRGAPNNKEFTINDDNYVAKKELTYSGGFHFIFKKWCIICYLDKKPN